VKRWSLSRPSGYWFLRGRDPQNATVKIVVWALLLVAAGLVVSGAARDYVTRSEGPDAVARRYFSALERGDVEGALREILPQDRPLADAFVRNNAGNRYRITGIAVEQAAVIERLSGAPPDARTITVFLNITQADGARWQAGPRVALVQEGGRWYFGRPPLQP
jgi:hypothetical protein